MHDSSFWQLVRARARKDALRALDMSLERVVIAILVGAIYLLLVWKGIGSTEGSSETLLRIALSLAPILALPLIYVWKFLAAPAAIYAELQARVDRVEKEKERLEEKLRSDRPTQDALDILGELLAEGVRRILTHTVTTEEQLRDFIAIDSDWTARLFEHLDRGFPKADALQVKNLGTITNARFSHARFPQQQIILGRFSRREELIRDLLRRGLQK